MIKKIFYFLAIGCFFIFAQKASAYSISPTRYLITIDPGKTETATIQVKNEEPLPLAFKLKVMGLSQDAQGKPVITEKADEAEGWVKPEVNTVEAGPGQTTTARFIITAPENAKPGSHYLALAVEPVVPENAGISISSRLVTLLTLQVGGLVRESLEIRQWGPEQDIVKDRNDWKFNLLLVNKGNIEVALKGVFSLKNWRGQEIFSEDKSLGSMLLSGAERNLQVDFNPRKANIYLPGLYQAQMKILYGRTGQTVVESANFWYLPYWTWIVLAAAAAVIILLIVLAVKAARRKR